MNQWKRRRRWKKMRKSYYRIGVWGQGGEGYINKKWAIYRYLYRGGGGWSYK